MSEDISRTKAWLMAARPQTLPAAAAPIIVGTAFAYESGVFALLPALAAFLGAALIQVATNFANDYFDAQKGADTEDREGFTRVTQSGLIPPEQVRNATIATFALAFVVGIYLVWLGGLPIVIIGLASIASGIAYTGGPYPFGYHGLGDLFVFVFFGLVAVTGTFYVQAVSYLSVVFPLWVPPGTVTEAVVIGSLPIAGLSTAILVVNNIRDKETDEATGKNTLAVRLGYRGSRIEFGAMFALAYATPLYLFGTGWPVSILLPFLSLPYALGVLRTVLTKTSGDALNPALEATGKVLAMYALLFGIGIAI